MIAKWEAKRLRDQMYEESRPKERPPYGLRIEYLRWITSPVPALAQQVK
jgi:hypothetical protein